MSRGLAQSWERWLRLLDVITASEGAHHRFYCRRRIRLNGEGLLQVWMQSAGRKSISKTSSGTLKLAGIVQSAPKKGTELCNTQLLSVALNSSQQWHPAEHRYEWMWKQIFFYFLTFSCIFCPQVVTKVSSKTKQDGRTVRSCGIEDSIETWKPAVSPSSLLSVLQHFPWRKWGMAAYA